MRGATTTTSWPVEVATRARAAMPGARTPSSLVTSIRTEPPVGDPPRCVGGELVRRRGLVRLPYDSGVAGLFRPSAYISALRRQAARPVSRLPLPGNRRVKGTAGV